MFFMFFNPMTNQELFDNADVGIHRPLGTSPIHRRGEAFKALGLAITNYEAIEQSLEGLKENVPDISIKEISRRYQCHTMGVSSSLSRLLRRVSWAVVCYREQHP